MFILIRRELFFIIWHKEILNHNTFPLIQVSELFSFYAPIIVNGG